MQNKTCWSSSSIPVLNVPVAPPRRWKVRRDFFNLNCNGHNCQSKVKTTSRILAPKPLTQFLSLTFLTWLYQNILQSDKAIVRKGLEIPNYPHRCRPHRFLGSMLQKQSKQVHVVFFQICEMKSLIYLIRPALRSSGGTWRRRWRRCQGRRPWGRPPLPGTRSRAGEVGDHLPYKFRYLTTALVESM